MSHKKRLEALENNPLHQAKQQTLEILAVWRPICLAAETAWLDSGDEHSRNQWLLDACNGKREPYQDDSEFRAWCTQWKQVKALVTEWHNTLSTSDRKTYLDWLDSLVLG